MDLMIQHPVAPLHQVPALPEDGNILEAIRPHDIREISQTKQQPSMVAHQSLSNDKENDTIENILRRIMKKIKR
jgi:hypothetical protein